MASKIKGNKPSEKEHCKIKRLQREWLKNNKPTKCKDAYLDNPYKRKPLPNNSIY